MVPTFSRRMNANYILQMQKKTDWGELVKELAKRFVIPQEKYEWRAGRLKITWDQNESFHVLAARVNRCPTIIAKKKSG